MSGSSTRRVTRSAGLKRTLGAASGDDNEAEKVEKRTSKRPALTAAFSNHLNQSSQSHQFLAAQTRITELQNALHEKQAMIDRLETDKRRLANLEEEERATKERQAEEFNEERERQATEIRRLRQSMTTLEGKYADLQDDHDRLSAESQSKLNSLQTLAETRQRDIIDLTSQLQRVTEDAHSQRDKITSLEQELEQLRESRTKLVVSNDDDLENATKLKKEEDVDQWKVISDELQRQTTHLRTLEASNSRLTNENERLQQHTQSFEVLREEKLGLERQLRGVDELRRKVGILEADLAAEKEKAASRQTDSSNPSSTPSIAFTKELSSLRTNYAVLLDEYGQLKAQYRSLQAQIADMSTEYESRTAETETIKAEAKKLKDRLFMMDRSNKRLDKELSFMREMLNSYKTEEAMLEEGVDVSRLHMEQQFETQQSLLDEYKLANQELEKELVKAREAREVSKRSTKKEEEWEKLLQDLELERSGRSELETSLKESTTAYESSLVKIDELEQTLFELQGEIGAGRHVPPGMRVLCLRDNPAQQWVDSRKEILEKLKKENRALLKRLGDLEESGLRAGGNANPNLTGDGTMTMELEDATDEGKGAKSMVPRESLESVIQEKTSLEDELKQKAKRMQRLQEVFAAKAKEFREAIESILGVKLAFYPNGQVRITSIFDLNATFVFQPSAGSSTDGSGKMTLIGIGQGDCGPPELPELMRYWVDQEMCIPGFLASVTLECYDIWKRNR